MEKQTGVVNPNQIQPIPDPIPNVDMELLLFSLSSGLVMGFLVMAVIVWIMKGAFNTRTNAASIISAFFLSGTAFMVFITVMMFYSKEIWLMSSVMLWTAVYMGSLWILQPDSLEKMIAKTRKDVEKMETKLEKQKKQDADREAKEASKAARKTEKARAKAVIVKNTTSTTANSTDTKKDLS